MGTTIDRDPDSIAYLYPVPDPIPIVVPEADGYQARSPYPVGSPQLPFARVHILE